MRKWLLILVFVICSPYKIFPCEVNLVPECGSRLGDRFLLLIRALWISNKYHMKIKLHEKFFPDEISQALPFEIIGQKGVSKRVEENSELARLKKLSEECQCNKRINCSLGKSIEKPQFRNEEFRELMQATFSGLKERVNVPDLSSSTINIALHYREGGLWDSDAAKTKFPKKFMGLPYFISGIGELLQILPEEYEVFVGVFSDSIDQSFMDIIREEIGRVRSKNIKIAYLTKLDQSPIRDFIYMSKFDFIVRSNSHFAKCSELIGNFVGSVRPDVNLKYGKRHSLRIHNYKLKCLLNRVSK